MISAESERLEAVALDSTYTTMTGEATTRYSALIFARYFRGEQCLELGPAEGVMTAHLVKHFPSVTVVEGSPTFAAMIAANYPEVIVHHCLIEQFKPGEKYDTIVLGHVLEHVDDPGRTLELVSSWLSSDGCVLAAVPNATSIHRQAAVIMGLLTDEHELNESDLHHGHRRVYDPDSLKKEFLDVGLKIEHFGGYWLKPLSNAQIEAHWSPEMLETFLQLGERFSDISAEIYMVATLP